MTIFDDLEGMFKGSIKDIQKQKNEAHNLLDQVPEGSEGREEANDILKAMGEMKTPADMMNIANMAKAKAYEIIKRNGNKDSTT